eukprot:5457365-Pyramimonas_sp.AAC.1
MPGRGRPRVADGFKHGSSHKRADARAGYSEPEHRKVDTIGTNQGKSKPNSIAQEKARGATRGLRNQLLQNLFLQL